MLQVHSHLSWSFIRQVAVILLVLLTYFSSTTYPCLYCTKHRAASLALIVIVPYVELGVARIYASSISRPDIVKKQPNLGLVFFVFVLYYGI